MKTAGYVCEIISVRSIFVVVTGAIYSLAKVGEIILKLPQAIVFTIFISYTIWITVNIAIESIAKNIPRARS